MSDVFRIRCFICGAAAEIVSTDPANPVDELEAREIAQDFGCPSCFGPVVLERSVLDG